MKLDLEYIYLKQIDLDNFIHKSNNLKDFDTYEKRKLAFLVELGEFINEVRSFKFWSKKPSSKKSILLEEYIDCLHFIISLGIYVKNTNWKVEIKPISNDINEQMIHTYSSFIKFVNSNFIEDYINALTDFISISKIMKFDFDEILKSYDEKNKININRQKTNY